MKFTKSEIKLIVISLKITWSELVRDIIAMEKGKGHTQESSELRSKANEANELIKKIES